MLSAVTVRDATIYTQGRPVVCELDDQKILHILTPPDMENVENRRISVRTYRLLAILSCHINVL